MLTAVLAMAMLLPTTPAPELVVTRPEGCGHIHRPARARRWLRGHVRSERAWLERAACPAHATLRVDPVRTGRACDGRCGAGATGAPATARSGRSASTGSSHRRRSWAISTGACESGNNPSAATGNGFWGSFQIPAVYVAIGGGSLRRGWPSNPVYASMASPGRWCRCNGCTTQERPDGRFAADEGRQVRTLSFTEISTALQCEAKHDFSYGDRLAGSALKSKTVLPVLSGGRCLGRDGGGLARLGRPRPGARGDVRLARTGTPSASASSVYHDREQHTELRERLERIFAHYDHDRRAAAAALARGGRCWSRCPRSTARRGRRSKYRFLAYFDGIHEDAEGRVWLIEFKLRARLSALDLVANSRSAPLVRLGLSAQAGQAGRRRDHRRALERVSEGASIW